MREALRAGRPPGPWIAATKGKGAAPSGAPISSMGPSKGGALSLSKRASEGGRLRDWLTGALTDEKGGGVLAGLTLRQLADVGERHLPQLKLLVRGMQAFQTERNKMFEQATGRVKEWRQFGRAEAARIAEIMHESTIAQWDPSKANGGASPFDAKEMPGGAFARSTAWRRCSAPT